MWGFCLVLLLKNPKDTKKPQQTPLNTNHFFHTYAVMREERKMGKENMCLFGHCQKFQYINGDMSQFTFVLLFDTFKAPMISYVMELISFQTFFAYELKEKLVD